MYNEFYSEKDYRKYFRLSIIIITYSFIGNDDENIRNFCGNFIYRKYGEVM